MKRASSPPRASRLPRLALPLVLSAGVHLALLGWLALRAPTPRPPPRGAEAIELLLDFEPEPLRPPAPPERDAQAPAREGRSSETAADDRQRRGATSRSSPEAQEETPSRSTRAEVPPAAADDAAARRDAVASGDAARSGDAAGSGAASAPGGPVADGDAAAGARAQAAWGADSPAARDPASSAERGGDGDLAPGERLADASRGAPSLLPSPDALPYDASARRQSGHTGHPGDPESSAEVRALEDRHRIEARLEGFREDAMADVRVQRGARHPYLTDLAGTVHDRLGRADGGTPAALGTGVLHGYVKQYLDAASAYARTGNPGLGEPGEAPTHSELLRERFGEGKETMWLRLQVQAKETERALQSRGPLYSLVVELDQGRDGALLALEVLQGSGNARFDAFVLSTLPGIVAEAGPPPAELFRRETLRTQWAVEGWLEASSRLEERLGMDMGLNLFGLPVDKLTDELTDEVRFDYRFRLLRQY